MSKIFNTLLPLMLLSIVCVGCGDTPEEILKADEEFGKNYNEAYDETAHALEQIQMWTAKLERLRRQERAAVKQGRNMVLDAASESVTYEEQIKELETKIDELTDSINKSDEPKNIE